MENVFLKGYRHGYVGVGSHPQYPITVCAILPAVTKFLHIADIHLGIRRYRSEDRARDFFLAWRDCIERFALAEKVSFVLIAGDLFDARRVEPQAMNQAMFCLSKLRHAGIPVVVIEGNHDCHESENRFSWLRSLSQWGFIKLLEPVYSESGVKLLPWDDEKCSGSFIDIDGVRIFGSIWYGSTVSQALPPLIDELRHHHSEKHFNVMMLHTDVEGQLNRPIPALPVVKINELKSYINYLALGHTHKNFEIDGWIYNPGSLEACNVDEYANVRGAYLVEIIEGQHTAHLMRDYHQRPVARLSFDVSKHPTPEELHADLFDQLRHDLTPHNPNDADSPAPVVELSLRGHLGFKNALLEINRIRDEIKQEFNSLLVIVRNQTVPVEYAVAAGLSEHVSRAERERRVIEDLISRDTRFREQAVAMAGLILEAKRLALSDELPAKIVELIEERLAESQTVLTAEMVWHQGTD
ncbi:MAG: metallophosphoesterase [Acidobacteria bacterium]|nr:metallophosphoesterase [Acidobacteriota bacterium]